MDEEVKSNGSIMNTESSDEISIIEDYTLLEGESVIIDDDSNLKPKSENLYNQAITEKEQLDQYAQQLRDKILSIIEKGEATKEDNDELRDLQEKYTECYTSIKSLDTTENTSSSNTTSVVDSTIISYETLIKTLMEKSTFLYLDNNGQVCIDGEAVPKIKVMELEAEKIKADLVETNELVATKATIEQLEAAKAEIEDLYVKNADIDDLVANKADINDLTAANANIGTLQAEVANIKELSADHATITQLNAVKADVEILDSTVGNIETLVNGNLTSDNILSFNITSDKVTVADAFIKDAMIYNVSADKIDVGTINTNNVSIQSEDGGISIVDETMQFKDEDGNVRIQIGRDGNNDFTFALYGANGEGQLINQDGIQKSSAIADGLIRNDHVANNANISGDKLDIESVVTEINDGSTTISSSKIYLNEQEQSLEVAFNSLKTQVDTIQDITIEGDLSAVINQVNSNTTQILANKEGISTLVAQDTIINKTISNLDGEIQEVNNTLSNKYTSLEQDLNGFKTTVNDTYATKGTVNDLEDNLETNYSTTSAMNSAINQKATEITTSVGNTYATKQSVTDLNTNLTTNYSTTTAMNSAISQKANEITSSVSETYATKESVETVDDKFDNYSTTTQMNSAINQKSNEILSTVSTTYQTIDDMKNYSTTTQMNSAIDQKADSILSTVSGTYATQETVEDIEENLTTNYSTTSDMNSAINQKADSILSTVSGTYATQTSVNNLSNNLTNNYSTTTQMNSAINQKAGEITSAVSETYATKTSVTDLNTNLTNNYSTTAQMNSAISQKAGEILSTVSETYVNNDTLDDTLEDYSTTTQMNSAISQSASDITSSVSSTYATKNDLSGEVSTLTSSISTVSQKADKISWLVKSGTSASDMVLTDSLYSLTTEKAMISAKQIELNGSININNGTFKVDTSGNMTANKGNFKGSITGSTFNSINDTFRVLDDGSVETNDLAASNTISAATLVGDYLNVPLYAPALTEDITVYINSGKTSATSLFDIASDDKLYCSSIDAFIDICPRNLNGYTVSIYLETDINDNISMDEFNNGYVRMNMQGKTIKGYLRVRGTGLHFNLYGNKYGSTAGTTKGKIIPNVGYGNTEGSTTRYFNLFLYTTRARIHDVDFYKGNADSNNYGICVSGGCSVIAKNIRAINKPTSLIRVIENSTAYIESSAGNTVNTAIQAIDGSIIHLADGTQAGGGSSNIYSNNGSQIFYNTASGKVTFDTEAATDTSNTNTSTGTTTTKTVTIKSTGGYSWRTSGSYASSWASDKVVRQGTWTSSLGHNKGYWFFGSEIYNILQNYSVTSMKIKITRQTGGSSAAVTHYLRAHTHSSKPTTPGDLLGTSTLNQSFSLAVGSSTTLSLTSTQISALKSAKAKGFALYTSTTTSGASGSYSCCSPSCTVTITYKS